MKEVKNPYVTNGTRVTVGGVRADGARASKITGNDLRIKKGD